jgi:hypothetical protein
MPSLQRGDNKIRRNSIRSNLAPESIPGASTSSKTTGVIQACKNVVAIILIDLNGMKRGEIARFKHKG